MTARIGIDARFYGPVGKGLGRYTKEVVDAVLRLDGKNEYVIFLGKDNFGGFRADNPRVRKVLADVRWYSLSEQVVMPRLIRREGIGLMHFPHFNVPLFCPSDFVVTIHDLILTKYPTQRATTLSPFFYKLKYAGYKKIIKAAVGKAAKVIAVSNFTRGDIARQFGIVEGRIAVTYEGVARGLAEPGWSGGKAFLKYGIDGPFLLYVGNAYPHKNLEGLVKVFPDIKKRISGLKLVLVGRDDYFYLRIKDLARSTDSRDIVFPGFVPDGDLAEFYRRALLYVFPSFYEGFGLPPLEAMAQGCPVASSDRTCLPEILGDAAFYFDPENGRDMADKIVRLAADGDLRRDFIAKGRVQAAKYSWEKCARETLEIYETAVESIKL